MKQEMYDKICRLLTEYEEAGDPEGTWEQTFYHMLVDITRAWEEIITADE